MLVYSSRSYERSCRNSTAKEVSVDLKQQKQMLEASVQFREMMNADETFSLKT
jgi:hypothetical protein